MSNDTPITDARLQQLAEAAGDEVLLRPGYTETLARVHPAALVRSLAKAILTLRERLAAAAREREDWRKNAAAYRTDMLLAKDRATAAEALAEKNAKDAERYRWLKEQSRDAMMERFELEIPCVDGGSFVATFSKSHDLDAAIDAARAGEKS